MEPTDDSRMKNVLHQAPASGTRVELLAHRSGQVAAAIHAVLLPAYAQEAALLNVQHFPPLLRSVADVRGSAESFLGAFVGDALAGVLSMAPDDEPGQTTVTMLVVHPAQQRRGLGRLLLQEAIRRTGHLPLSVSTAAGNVPALALYASMGFAIYRHGTIGPDALPLVKLRRMSGPAPIDVGVSGDLGDWGDRGDLDDLGISPHDLARRGLLPQPEATALELADMGTDGRQFLLTQQAAAAWRAMKAAAAQDGIVLILESAFRSIRRQGDILRAKLAAGDSIAQALLLVAPPGYSEHHTGRAIDIGTPDSAALEEAFEHTVAFAWLQAHAAGFGFSMSYPRGNAAGYSYEPWHWCHGNTEEP